MNVAALYKKKDELEDELFDIDAQIQNRWQIIMGPGCGYFDDWGYAKGIVSVGYEHRGNHGTDNIPVEFFEIPDDQEAKERYREYHEMQVKEAALKNKQHKEDNEKKLYAKLKAKYDV